MPLPAVLGGLVGIIGWVNSIPRELLYVLFLASLATETGIAGAFGLQSGLISGMVSFIISTLFNLPGFAVTSAQLLVLFLLLPVFYFALKN